MAAPQCARAIADFQHPVAESVGAHAGNPVEIFAAEGAFGRAAVRPRPGQDFEKAGSARKIVGHRSGSWLTRGGSRGQGPCGRGGEAIGQPRHVGRMAVRAGPAARPTEYTQRSEESPRGEEWLLRV